MSKFNPGDVIQDSIGRIGKILRIRRKIHEDGYEYVIEYNDKNFVGCNLIFIGDITDAIIDMRARAKYTYIKKCNHRFIDSFEYKKKE